MEYGIQMYSVRDITEKNMDGALKALAEMGYKFVEFAGFFGIPADEIKAMLDKYGLKVSGTHTGWQEIAEHYEETLAYHKAIGNTRIIVPGADLTTKAKLDAFIDMMNEFQPKLAAEGVWTSGRIIDLVGAIFFALAGITLLVIVGVHVYREWKEPAQNQQNGGNNDE